MQPYQTTTYDNDFNKQGSPRVYRRNDGYPGGDSSPRRHYDDQQFTPRDAPQNGPPRYYKAAPREHSEQRYDGPPSHRGEPYYVQPTYKSPHHSPEPQRRGVPEYRGSPQPQYNPHYGKYGQQRDFDLPPKNPMLNSTTQKDYGDWSQRSPRNEPYNNDFGSPRRENPMPIIARSVEDPHHRYEALVKTNNPVERSDPNSVQHPVHRYEPVEKHPSRAQTGGGVYMFIRTSDDMFPTVKKAFQVHTGGLPERRLLGIATKECIRVMQNGEGWRRLKITATYKGNHYEEKSEPGEVTSNLSVMWFGSCNDAIEWYNRDFNFKTANFPPPNGSEISVLPLKYTLGWDPKAYYMLMQFTNVFDKRAVEYFVQEMVSELRNYRADAAFINGYPDKYHYKKSLHHYDKDHIVCHRFNNMQDAESFYHGFVGPNQQKLGNAAKLNSVIIFTLMDILGRR